MSKHTPGPWGINKYGGVGAGKNFLCPVIIDSTGDPFDGFHVFDGKGDLSKEEIAANVALIAAAPELLEACKALVIAINEPRETMQQAYHDAYAVAIKAIAKAEGQ